MKNNDILREELARMRQLMGMNGSLYQKPIMGEHDKHGKAEPFGPGSKAPDEKMYKGGPKDPGYQKDFAHWSEHNKAPAPKPGLKPKPKPKPPAPKPPAPKPPAPKPSPKAKTKTQITKTTKPSGKSLKGDYVLPMGNIPGLGSKGSSRFGKGKFNKGPVKTKSTKGVKRAKQKTRKKIRNKKKKD
jgi:hypothetical protein